MELFKKSMKQLLVMGVLLLVTGLWSCNDPSSKLPEAPGVSELADVLQFTEEGGTQSVTFSTNRKWTASLLGNLDSAKEPWCTLSAESGNAGTSTLHINVLALRGDYREAVLVINASAAGQEIVISQSGQPVITTSDAVEVTEASAVLGGAWYYSGDMVVTEFGVELAEQGGSYTRYPVAELAEDGKLTVKVEGLNSETTYTHRVYVQTEQAAYVGEEKQFTTDKVPERIAIAALKEAARKLAVGGQQTYAESAFVEGVVIASFVPAAEQPEQAYILLQDGTEANSGVMLTFATVAEQTFEVGDQLEVRLKDGVLSHGKDGAVKMAPLAAGIRVLATGKNIEPKAVDHTKLADYEAMRVMIEKTQLTRLFLNATTYPTWGSSELWNMEVAESEVSYSIQVLPNSALASKTPKSGSGSVSGIVYLHTSGDHVLRCEAESDVATLTEERFASMLELAFLKPEFKGSLVVGEEANSSVVIPYRNGDFSTIAGTISVEVSGAAAEGLTVASVTDYQIGSGLGEISLQVSGVPTTAGEVIFTVVGFAELGSSNSCTAEVMKPEVPEVGNFEAVWDTNTAKGDSVMQLSTNSNSAITVSEWTLTASSANITGTKWADFAAVGWDANESVMAPVQYFSTTLKIGGGVTLALSGLDITHRINGGDINLSIQYAVNGGAFTEIEQMLLTTATEPFTVNLGKVAALKSLAEGTTLTIRLVPTATNAKTKWGIKAKSRFALYGNAQ